MPVEAGGDRPRDDRREDRREQRSVGTARAPGDPHDDRQERGQQQEESDEAELGADLRRRAESASSPSIHLPWGRFEDCFVGAGARPPQGVALELVDGYVQSAIRPLSVILVQPLAPFAGRRRVAEDLGRSPRDERLVLPGRIEREGARRRAPP